MLHVKSLLFMAKESSVYLFGHGRLSLVCFYVSCSIPITTALPVPPHSLLSMKGHSSLIQWTNITIFLSAQGHRYHYAWDPACSTHFLMKTLFFQSILTGCIMLLVSLCFHMFSRYYIVWIPLPSLFIETISTFTSTKAI